MQATPCRAISRARSSTSWLKCSARFVREAIGDRTDLIIVGHSLAGFTAPPVADRFGADVLVLVAGMIPDEIDGGHCAALSHPGQLADVLETYAKT